MEPILTFVAMALVVIGLIGQGFEMKKIRASTRADEQLNPQNVFTDRRNFKWYGIIAAGFVLGYVGSA
jgi:Na+/H+ antiporter NhaD/arsenite permease-like protein